MSKYTAMFLQEVRENLATLNQLVVQLEKEPTNIELLQEIMRLSHSSKSMAASVEYHTTSDLFHALEDVFDAARQGTIHITGSLIDLCFQAFDHIEQSLQSIETSNKETDCTAATQALHAAFATAQQEETNQDSTDAPQEEAHAETLMPLHTINPIHTIRVTTEKVDTITNLAGELTLIQQQIHHAQQEGSVSTSMIEELNRLVEELTYHSIELRLVPLEQAFVQFPRMVRDLAKQQNKNVRFEMNGIDMNLDKTLVDHLIAPVTHMLRNAVDHGIESVEERTNAGKNPEGVIHLSVERTHGFARVSVTDDGRTIDVEHLKEIAAQREFSQTELASIDAENVVDLLCSPRFSSSETITDISGRGVGLSAVQQSAQSLGGHFTLEHTPNQKVFSLSLPLQLSIVPSLLIDVSACRYALPLIHVQRLQTVAKQDVQSTMGQQAMIMEEQSVPLLFLADLFSDHAAEVQTILSPVQAKEEETPKSAQQQSQNEHYTVVVVGSGDKRVGLVVDSVLGNENIMVKPVSPIIRTVEYYAGSTILSDGSVAIILDVTSLIRAHKTLLSSSAS